MKSLCRADLRGHHYACQSGQKSWSCGNSHGDFRYRRRFSAYFFGTLSQQAMIPFKNKLSVTGKTGKLIFGGMLTLLGVLIITGLV
ncbi:MAG: hypothetical protein Q8S48_09815 [Methylococcaceae bacterium]|nr:hypothetical protein [Methylococcaceae bacterium]MDP3390245.1 hypothetical protein [Methylococcaceae bacterium]